MKTIGININKNAVTIAQLSSNKDRFTLEQAHTIRINQTQDQTASAGIKTLLSGTDFSKKAKTTTNAPTEKIFFQPLTTEVDNTQDLQQLLRFQMEEDFPIPFDQLITTICSKRKTQNSQNQYLIAAIDRADLQKTIAPITAANLQTPTVTSDAIAIAALMSLDKNFTQTPNSMIISADASAIILALCDKGKPIYIRHLNRKDYTNTQNTIDTAKLSDEIELTLLAFFSQNTPADLKFFITETTPQAKEISQKLNESTNHQSTLINPLANIDCQTKDADPDENILIATSLAVIAAGKSENSPVFLDTEISQASSTAEIKRGIYAFAALLIIIATLVTAKIFYRQNTLENQNKTLNLQIRNTFKETLPAENNIVDELAQLTEKLNSLQTEHDAISNGINNKINPLKTLRQISQATPDKNIIIDMISITPTQTKLSGTAPTFDSVDKLLIAIRKLPGFENAKPKGINALPQQNRVRFNITTTMESTK